MQIFRPSRVLLGAAALALPLSLQAASYAYLNDNNVQSGAPNPIGNTYPKIMQSETKSFKATAQQFSKYDVVSGKPGSANSLNKIENVDSSVRMHYAFSPRAYQGEKLSGCDVNMGLPFTSNGPATANCQVYAGHWLYYAGTQTTSSISATATSIKVKDASRITAGKYVVIYNAPAGSFNSAEHARVTGVNRSTNTITVSRGYKSTPKSHGANAIIAEHATGRGGSALNWAYNLTTVCPKDSNGRNIAQAMVAWLGASYTKKGVNQTSGVGWDGFLFDADPWVNNGDSTTGKLDGNNDLSGDRLYSGAGVNWWGDGVDQFYELMHNRFPSMMMVGGYKSSRGFPGLNGTQMEGFPVAGGMEAVNPDYGHKGGNDGFDSQFQRYNIHTQFHNTNSGHTEALSRTPSKTYPGGHSGATNRPMRFALGSVLLSNGYYGEENSAQHPDRWYDEYAVDSNASSGTFGQAIKSNPSNEANVRSHKGWLGKPMGGFTRVYGTEFVSTKNKVGNGGFEGGSSGWSTKNMVISVDSSTSMEGGKSLKFVRHSSPSNSISGASVSGPKISITKGKQYTLAFSVKASKTREVTVRVQGARGTYLVPTKWIRVVHTFYATASGSFSPSFEVGEQDVPMWLDAVYLFEGNANVFRRDFEKGIVVVNATPTSRTVALGGTFQRIKGTQDGAVNNGSQLSSVTLPPYDAAILLRRKGEQKSAGSGGSGGTGSGGSTDGGSTGGGSTGGTGTGSGSCGAPNIVIDGTARVYVWKDTCKTNVWNIRSTKNGQASIALKFKSRNGALSNLQKYMFEKDDTAWLTASSTRADSTMKMWSGEDGISVKAPASGVLCLQVSTPAGVKVFRGANATASSKTVNVRNGSSCSVG